MDMNAKIAAISAGIAFLSLLATIGFSIWSALSARRASKIAIGEAETSLRTAITVAQAEIWWPNPYGVA